MAEDFNPTKEGQRIAREYLSKHGWAAEWRRALDRQLYPGFQREEYETKQRQCDQMVSDADDNFSAAVEQYRHNNSAQARAVKQAIVDLLGRRTDLSLIAKSLVDRLKRELGPI